MPHEPTSAFLSEVLDQPKALRDLAALYQKVGRPALVQCAAAARKHGRVHVTGMGTSAFAADAVIPRLARAGIDATATDAGELLHDPRPLQGLLLAISQSGESVETCKLAAVLRGRLPMAAIVNNPQSTLARRRGIVPGAFRHGAKITARE